MTIYEHHRVSADHHGTTADAAHGTHALVDRLTAGEAFAVAFGGQGGAWLETLEELVSSAGIESELATLVGEVELLLEPVEREPSSCGPSVLSRCAGSAHWLPKTRFRPPSS